MTTPAEKVRVSIAMNPPILLVDYGRELALNGTAVVRVEAPSSAKSQAPIDLVTLISISHSMSWPAASSPTDETPSTSRLDLLKNAMKFVMRQLNDDDRLAVVAFNDQVVKEHTTGILEMSGGGRVAMERKVDGLVAKGDDGTAFKPSLEYAVKILSDRTMIYCIDIHPTEPLILITHYRTSHFCILNYHTKEMTEVLVGPHDVYVAKFIPSKKWIVAGDKEGDIYVYGYDPINKIRVLKEHNDEIRSLAVHPTETYMLSTCKGGKILLWDIGKDWRVKKTFQTGNYGQLAVFGPKDSDIFAFTDIPGFAIFLPGFAIKIRNLHSGECMVELSGHSDYPSCFDYFSHGDELYMITGSQDKTAKIWDCVTGACVQTLRGHTGIVTTVCCHPDLPLLITGSEDGTVCLWNSTNFSLERVLNFDLEWVRTVACLKGTTWIAIAHWPEGLVLADIGPEEPCA